MLDFRLRALARPRACVCVRCVCVCLCVPLSLQQQTVLQLYYRLVAVPSRLIFNNDDEVDDNDNDITTQSCNYRS